jgi:hypothetical protein
VDIRERFHGPVEEAVDSFSPFVDSVRGNEPVTPEQALQTARDFAEQWRGVSPVVRREVEDKLREAEGMGKLRAYQNASLRRCLTVLGQDQAPAVPKTADEAEKLLTELAAEIAPLSQRLEVLGQRPKDSLTKEEREELSRIEGEVGALVEQFDSVQSLRTELSLIRDKGILRDAKLGFEISTSFSAFPGTIAASATLLGILIQSRDPGSARQAVNPYVGASGSFFVVGKGRDLCLRKYPDGMPVPDDKQVIKGRLLRGRLWAKEKTAGIAGLTVTTGHAVRGDEVRGVIPIPLLAPAIHVASDTVGASIAPAWVVLGHLIGAFAPLVAHWPGPLRVLPYLLDVRVTVRVGDPRLDPVNKAATRMVAWLTAAMAEGQDSVASSRAGALVGRGVARAKAVVTRSSKVTAQSEGIETHPS